MMGRWPWAPGLCSRGAVGEGLLSLKSPSRNMHKSEIVQGESLSVQEEREKKSKNGFKMNEGGWGVGRFQRETVKGGKVRFFFFF